jgi:polyhydroxyalkanoate synthesis regulator phasin
MSYLRAILSLSVVLLIGLSLGCGGTYEESSAEPAGSEAAAETEQAAEEATDTVAETAETIQAEIAEKEAELAAITEQIEQLSPEDLLAEAGKELQAKAEALRQQIEELKAKL